MVTDGQRQREREKTRRGEGGAKQNILSEYLQRTAVRSVFGV